MSITIMNDIRKQKQIVGRANENGCELAFIIMEFIALTEGSGLQKMEGCEAWTRVHANAQKWIDYIANGSVKPE